jgi:hypothetical protein
VIRAYAVALPALKARRQLEAIQAASVPYMKPEAVAEIIGHLLSAADLPTVKATAATPADLAASGIQVEYVQTEEVN